VGADVRWGAAAGTTEAQNDTWIAACCVRHGVPLVTLNTKDFALFVQHDGLVLRTDAN
jgi:predicted nucleic acid-binding protein